MERLGELMESEDERVSAVACNSVLDRAYGKPEARRPEATVDLVARLERMSDEQRLEEARKLADRVRARLDRDRHLIDVTPEVEE